MDKALEFCVSNNLNSAVDFKEALKHYSKMTVDLTDLDGTI